MKRMIPHNGRGSVMAWACVAANRTGSQLFIDC